MFVFTLVYNIRTMQSSLSKLSLRWRILIIFLVIGLLFVIRLGWLSWNAPTLVISPSSLEVRENNLKKFSLRFDPDGPKGSKPDEDVTQDASWHSSDITLASVSDARPIKGEVLGRAAGSVMITASYDGIETSAHVVVIPAAIDIACFPPKKEIKLGETAVWVAKFPHHPDEIHEDGYDSYNHGVGRSTVTWSGTDVKSTDPIHDSVLVKKYLTRGQKMAQVEIVDYKGNNAHHTCEDSIFVK